MSDAYAYSIAEPEICTMKHEPQPSSDREEFSLEAVSALFDGEGDLAALDQLLAAEANSAAHAHWHSCALIGDALRATGKGRWQSSTAFLAGVRSQLDAITPANVQPIAEVVHAAASQAAANDSVFRWKMVAGLASLAAVAVVGWATLLGSGASGPSAASQLAQAPGAPTAAAQAVLVATPQGPVVRDPRLEQLLAEHRQHGGMTALQASTGFLRNATFDAGDNR